jgi:hypothetical protein
MTRIALALGFALSALLLAPAAGSRPVVGACSASVDHRVLPPWARGGFSDPKPRMPHVLGRSGRIAAILFGYPLRSPPWPRRANKILWVSRTAIETPTALWIHAQRMEGDRPVGEPAERVLAGGPGPSYVNLPQPGCWRLTVSWAGRRDVLDLGYSVGR